MYHADRSVAFRPLMRFAHPVALALLCLSLAACASTSVREPAQVDEVVDRPSVGWNVPPAGSELTVATWNVEHLAYPMSAGCVPRTERQIRQLQRYAERVNADIFALQEVASIDALALVFPKSDWQLFISDRPDSESYECRDSGAPSTQQKTAFAVKKHINVLGAESRSEFGLDDPGLRYGLVLTVDSPIGELRMLNVHMKSGCFVDDFSREETEACELYARQAPVLDAWIEEGERLGQPYVVLGDFNHRLSAPYNAMTRLLSDNSDGSRSSLVNQTGHLTACHPYYPAPIDMIFAGHLDDPALAMTPIVHVFENMDPDQMLSDHCAVSLQIERIELPLSTSVTWQTTSKEYRFLTTSTYRRASRMLNDAELPSSPWVVVMDIDETVLDNGAYQVNLDKTGRSFSSATWADWVASEQATLVPGAAAFINTVIELGGRLGFVTNRDRSRDQHSWNNMRALGLPVTASNACLMGRSPDDVASVDGETFINDKDLRRRQLTDGTASCYAPSGNRREDFPGSTIVMQVGDNIQDFSGMTQENADIDALIASERPLYVLLPNAMYGSW